MNKIIKTSGKITAINDLSPTAREYVITPAIMMPFIAGAFVNIFVDVAGEKVRRAFSMSSSDTKSNSFTLSIRLSPGGKLTPVLWKENFLGREIELMGPLGLNTADKMKSKRLFLFGFGVGAGVTKSLAAHFATRPDLESLTIVTGNRSIEEILHKDFFDTLATENGPVSIKYIVSDTSQTIYPTGYIQNHLADYDFTDADIYMCGQKVACDALQEAVLATQPQNCHFFIEDFH